MFAERGGDGVALVAQVEAQIERDLVVAAARGVQLRAGVADAPRQLGLDVHVDVFELGLELELSRLDFRADLAQPGDDLRPLLRR